MSPLPYQPEFPSRQEHPVTDKQGVEWTARYDGICLRASSYDWRVLFDRPGASAQAYVEPGTSLEHESFLRDLLVEAEPTPAFSPVDSGDFFDFIEDVVAERVAWSSGEVARGHRIIRLDPSGLDLKIELSGHIYPTHSDSLRRIIDMAIVEVLGRNGSG